MDFGYVIINGKNDYTINVDLNVFGSGYNVVPKEVDPYNKYNIEDVRAYCEANPQMILTEHPLAARFNLEIEMNTLQSYLAKTDYMVVKCAEKGVSMAAEYPSEYVKRQQARDRINELRALIGEK
jgi:hypothetical protein